MDFLPWTTFTRIVDRLSVGDHRCPDAFTAPSNTGPWPSPRLTYRRKRCAVIETCLSVHASKLYHMGFRQPLRRSTLADANERRDWRIHAALAQRLITQARTLYVDEELGLDLTIPSTPWTRRPSLLPVGLSCGALPPIQGGGEDATRKLDLRLPFRVLSTSRDGKRHERSCPRSLARKLRSPTSWIVYVEAFMCCTKPGPSSSRVQVEQGCSSRLFGADWIGFDPASFATRPSPWTASTPVRITPNFCGASASRTPSPARRWSSSPNNFSLPAATICAALQKPLAGGTLLQVRSSASIFDQAVLRHRRRTFGEDADLPLPPRSTLPMIAIVKKRLDLDASLYTLLQASYIKHCAGDENRWFANNQPIVYSHF